MAGSRSQKYTFFWRSGSPFNQRFKCNFTVQGRRYTCAEQYMMHQKAVLFGDHETAEKIMNSDSPEEQKSLGRSVVNFEPNTWNKKSSEIVFSGNFAKFSQNEGIRRQLLNTRGTTLVEASPIDNIWGIGLPEDDPRAQDQTKWEGENKLGFILTHVREAIMKEEEKLMKQTLPTTGVTDYRIESGSSSWSGPEKYTYFWRSESPFSQWHTCTFSVEGLTYGCAEQYMMHQKAVLFGDEGNADAIMKAKSPKAQKSLGRKVSNFDERIWNENCESIVYKGNLAKFSQNDHLREQLLETKGTILVEASPMDTIWGIGLAEDNPKAKLRKTWRGKNRLGFILTDVREAIMRGEALENRRPTAGPMKGRPTGTPGPPQVLPSGENDFPKLGEPTKKVKRDGESENRQLTYADRMKGNKPLSQPLSSPSGASEDAPAPAMQNKGGAWGSSQTQGSSSKDQSRENFVRPTDPDEHEKVPRSSEAPRINKIGSDSVPVSTLDNAQPVTGSNKEKMPNERKGESWAVQSNNRTATDKNAATPESGMKESQVSESNLTKSGLSASLEDIPWLVVKDKKKKKKKGKNK